MSDPIMAMPGNIFEKADREQWLEDQLRYGIAAQIRALREQRGWSQVELGRRSGMTQEGISRLENPQGRGLPTIRSLKRIAAAFDVALIIRFGPWSFLLTGKRFDWIAPVLSFEEEFGAVEEAGGAVVRPAGVARVQGRALRRLR